MAKPKDGRGDFRRFLAEVWDHHHIKMLVYYVCTDYIPALIFTLRSAGLTLGTVATPQQTGKGGREFHMEGLA